MSTLGRCERMLLRPPHLTLENPREWVLRVNSFKVQRIHTYMVLAPKRGGTSTDHGFF